jgi:sterol desaturase/sphingolipid hydroxylase (fatty acid hydroxylase superfamily)
MLETISEPGLRFGVFAGVFAAMAVLEWLWPRRSLRVGKRRWLTNIGLAVTGSLVVRGLGLIAGPLVAVGAAVLAKGQGWGLFNIVSWPPLLVFAVCVLVLDFAIWLQHVASHKIPVLWRFHRMHHADIDFDLTTGVRFHPVEIGLSMLYKVVWVLALGAPVGAVIAFEVILNAAAMFNHANVRLPLGFDRVLRLIIVTPDMHRVHHSIDPREHDTNYGFSLSIWDRGFATYTPQPAAGHEAMTIGLAPWQDETPAGFAWCLKLPWAGRGAGRAKP